MKEAAKFVLWVVAILALVAGILRATKIDEIAVSDDRMAPTILAGDRVLLWRGATVEQGDIVVCANPVRPGEFVMGRVIATPGMQIGGDRRGLLVNGRPFDRDLRGQTRFVDQLAHGPVNVRWGTRVSYTEAHEFMVRENYTFTIRPVRIPAGRAFLLSDYESMPGLDSRTFGPVEISTCLGEVFMRLAPSPNGSTGEAPFDHGYLDVLD